MSKIYADSQIIWMDGKLVPYNAAHVHVLSHSLHYGGAAFEGIRAYKTAAGQPAIFRVKEHYQRFIESMRVLDYVCPYSVDELLAATMACMKANSFDECYIRPLAYLDDRARGLKLPSDLEARIAIAAWPWGQYLGAGSQKNGIRAMISSFGRANPADSLPSAKLSGNYLASILARREASKNNLDEAILLGSDGFVAEGSGENIFVVRSGRIFTPPKGSILPGITRHCVFELANHLKVEIGETPISRNDLYLSDEAFFSGTAVEVTPILEVDHYKIGSGKPGVITEKIATAFRQATRGELKAFSHWLTPVE